MIRFAEAQRAELTRPGASPAERMLVDRVVVCALQLNYFSATEASAVEGKEPPKLHQWWAKRHAQAQRAFQAALASLLTVQKLFPAVPTRVAAPITAAEPESLPAPNRDTVPAVGVKQSEDQPELSTFRSTSWPEPTEDSVATPNLLTVRG